MPKILSTASATAVGLAILLLGGEAACALLRSDVANSAAVFPLAFLARLLAVALWFTAGALAAAAALRIGRRWWLAFAGCGLMVVAVLTGIVDLPLPGSMLAAALTVPFGAASLVVRLMPRQSRRPVRRHFDRMIESALRPAPEALYRGA